MPIQSIEVSLKVKVVDGTETSTMSFVADVGKCPDSMLEVPQVVAAALAKKLAIVSAGSVAQADKIAVLEKTIAKLSAQTVVQPKPIEVTVAAVEEEAKGFGSHKRSRK